MGRENASKEEVIEATKKARFRALSVASKLVILDEATAELDPTVMLHILELLKRLQNETGCAYLFNTHNFRVASFINGLFRLWNNPFLLVLLHDPIQADKGSAPGNTHAQDHHDKCSGCHFVSSEFFL